ncbi:toxin VasX [Gilliamella sp. wkB7]|uniref:toxin VasX n=2 Tax=unclassified Gilliamella TaxID=2685620 RepID=UPI000AF72E19|nr:toxin VasX [Gilliamella apicola]
MTGNLENTEQTETISKEKQKKAEDLEDRIIYGELDKGKDSHSPLANGNCGVCERKGFPIFLVRKAPVSASFISAHNIGLAEKKLSDDNREPEVDLITHKYVYRTLRVGYVYILVKHKQKGWEFMGYEVTPSGVFRHKTITDVKERNVKEIPTDCTKDGNNHHIPGSFINIDTSVYEGEAYIAYTRRAWSQGKNSTIEKYLKLMNESSLTIDLPSKKEQDSSESQDEAAQVVERNTKTIELDTALKRFTKINLNEESYKDPDKLTEGGKRSFRFSQLKSANSLLELAVDPKMIVHNDNENNDEDNQKELIQDENTFITAHKFNSLRDRKGKGAEKGNGVEYEYEAESSKLRDQIEKFQQSGKYVVPVVIVEDPFGIAEELSLQRQLKIEPITQIIIKSEEIYSKKINEHYNQIIKSNKRLDKQINAHINQQEPKPESLSSSQVDKYQYQEIFNRLGLEKNNYFSEERLHKRKTLSLINEYRNQIVSSETAKAEDKIYYDFALINNVSEPPGEISDFPLTKRYLEKGYEEVEMTLEEKQKKLEEMNDQFRPLYDYIDVKKFRENNTAEQNAKNNIAKELAKYNELLDQKEELDFIHQEKNDYDKFLKTIATHSQDYFYYLSWLFGFKDYSKYAPTAITKFNDCEFWLLECDTNCSNNHVGYLTDFLKLIDFTCLGGIKTEVQSAVWDALLTNLNSLFFHLIDGQKSSFWELLLNKRLGILQQELATYPSFQPQLANKNKEELKKYIAECAEKEKTAKEKRQQQTKQILQEFEESQGDGKLADDFFCEKGELMLTLYTMLISRVMSGLANRPLECPQNEQLSPEQEKSLVTKQAEEIKHQIMPLMFQSAMVMQGNLMFNFQLQNIPGVELSSILNYMESLATTGKELSYDKHPITNSNQNDTINWSFFSEGADYVSQIIKIAEIVRNGDMVLRGQNLFRAIRACLTMPMMRNWSDFTIRLNFVKNNLLDVFNEVKVQFCESLSGSITNTRLNTNTPPKKEVMFSVGKIVLAGIQAEASRHLYYQNMEALQDLSISQTLRFQLERDAKFGYCKMLANYSSLINEVMVFLNNTLAPIFRGILDASRTLRMFSNGVLKTSVAVSGVFGIVTSVITVIEGGMLMMKGWSKGGKVGTAYMIAGGLQMFSGFITLMQSVGLLSLLGGPIAGGLFVLGLVAAFVSTIILSIFKDESDDWNSMQIWFNYCLFGLKKPTDKGKAYLSSFDSMAMAINDYMVARSGVYAVIHLGNSTFYSDKTRANKDVMAATSGIVTTFPIFTAVDSASKEVYISLGLPNYDLNISDYEGMLRFYDAKSNEVATVKLSNGEKYPILDFVDNSPTDILVKRPEPLKPVTREKDLRKSKVGRVESYKDAADEEGKNLGYFQIYYKTGECYFPVDSEIYMQVLYWPKGKTIKNDQNKSVETHPIVIHDTVKSEIFS